MPNLGPTELIIIAVVVIILFGSRRLPDAARSLGRSMRIFKSEVKEMSKDDEALPAPAQQQIQPQPIQPQQVAQPVQQPVQQPTQQYQQPAQPQQQQYQQPSN
ncbi:Sec-independent protein translocase subunit TatA [Corynebacterium aquilae]|uniref:Sec-independent protein translocase protein TatA n=1 Tax=Corynebacterium aquilae DSM 44791 TaxID=1431546 RepID=A0A1L7CFZ0_9CORY|nr:Sec-independent protein translocase subunit TatA [Corynebacterium aquilae]APT84748.1 hypothetical protein CAQU_06320 [Corynebacterium aquilae DSM 44791]